MFQDKNGSIQCVLLVHFALDQRRGTAKRGPIDSCRIPVSTLKKVASFTQNHDLCLSWNEP